MTYIVPPTSWLIPIYFVLKYINNSLHTKFAGENDVTEKPVDPIKVYSEKELIREFEKIASTLVPEKDWSVRIVAMQRIEGLVIGGLHLSTILSTQFFLVHTGILNINWCLLMMWL